MQNDWQLFWRQGQFLTPQHFQQLDLYNSGQLSHVWQQISTFPWGVLELDIRHEGLAAQELDIRRCVLLTRHGTRLCAGSAATERNAIVEKRSFQGLMDPAGGPLSVYLGLPNYRMGQANVSLDEVRSAAGLVPPRFRVTSNPRQDLFRPDNPGAPNVDFVQLNLVLFFDREEAFRNILDATEAMKIAEIIPSRSGRDAVLSTAYIPPCLRVSSSQGLSERLEEARDLLTKKALEFESVKRKRPDPVRLMILQTIGRYTPLLHHIAETGANHPEVVYKLMRQMIGEFSAFTEQVGTLGRINGADADDDGDLRRYDHENIALCIDLALSRLRVLLSDLDPGDDAGIPFIWSDPYYTVSLPAEIFEAVNMQYFIVFEHRLVGEELRQMLLGKGAKPGKISPLDEMEQLRQSALFGLKMDLITADVPSNLPRGKNKTYFRINTSSTMWEGIVKKPKKRNLAIFCGLEPGETKVKFFAVKDA